MESPPRPGYSTRHDLVRSVLAMARDSLEDQSRLPTDVEACAALMPPVPRQFGESAYVHVYHRFPITAEVIESHELVPLADYLEFERRFRSEQWQLQLRCPRTRKIDYEEWSRCVVVARRGDDDRWAVAELWAENGHKPNLGIVREHLERTQKEWDDAQAQRRAELAERKRKQEQDERDEEEREAREKRLREEEDERTLSTPTFLTPLPAQPPAKKSKADEEARRRASELCASCACADFPDCRAEGAQSGALCADCSGEPFHVRTREREAARKRPKCGECRCRGYPDCTLGGEACDYCIDGATGAHKRLT